MTRPAALLSEADRATLAAAFARILPDDETGPGAGAANVIGFVELALRNGNCRQHVERVMAHLYLLDQFSLGLHGCAFASASPTQQDQVLRQLRETPHPSAVRWLASAIRLALAGFLCPPRHGGNVGGCGWRFVGYEPHPRIVNDLPAAT